MKFVNLKAFEKHLLDASPNHFSNIYVVNTKDPFLSKEITDKVIDTLSKNIINISLSYKIFDGNQLESAALLAELNSQSFFSEYQLVRINNAQTIPKDVLLTLESYFEQINPKIYLVFSAHALLSTTNFYKKAEKIAVFVEVDEEKGAAKEKSASEWIQKKIATLGKTIEPRAIQLLVRQLGSDLSILNSEVEKLACYVGDRANVTAQDVSAICTSINLETIWQLGEAIFSLDSATALKNGKALLQDGLALISLLRQIRGQFQTDFQVCSILSRGGSEQEITKLFPYMKGFILERHLKMARNYGMHRFHRGLLKIDETELMAKNSATNENLLLEVLLVNLTA